MKDRSIRVLTGYLPPLVALVLLDASAALAAEPDDSRPRRETATLTTSLLTPLFGTYYLELNVRASDAFGVLFNTSYLSLDKGDWNITAGTVGAGLSYHFQGDALRRWYVQAWGEAMFSFWRHDPSAEIASIVVGYSGEAIVGYRFVCELGPVLDLGAGVIFFRFPSARVETAEGPVSSEAFSRLYPAAKVNAGWAF
jgi:hypothetical protein